MDYSNASDLKTRNLDAGKNILVFGVQDNFGEKLVNDLAVDGNTLLLCGDSEFQQRKLINRNPESVKGISGINTLEHRKSVQTMIESQGSLDVVIHLITPGPTYSFLGQSADQVQQTFQTNLIDPIIWLQAIFPYLRKSSDCKVIFVDTAMFTKQPNPSAAHSASHYGLWGFCLGLEQELAHLGVDVTSISTPALNHSRSAVEQSEKPAMDSGTKLQYRTVMSKISEVIRSAGNAALPTPEFELKSAASL